MSRTKGPENEATPPGAQSPPREPGSRRGDANRQDEADGHAGRRAGTEREADDFAEQTGYQPSVNQGRHEPMPASHHDERRQEAVVRNEELGSGQPRATPSRRAQRRDRG
jgi:hypothetical protein